MEEARGTPRSGGAHPAGLHREKSSREVGHGEASVGPPGCPLLPPPTPAPYLRFLLLPVLKLRGSSHGFPALVPHRAANFQPKCPADPPRPPTPAAQPPARPRCPAWPRREDGRRRRRGGGEGGRKRREDTGTDTGVDLPSPRPAPPALSPLPRGALPAAPSRRARLPPGAPPAPLRRHRPVMPRGLSPPPPALPCAPPGSPSGSGVPPDPTHPRSCPGAPQLPRCGSTAGGAAAGKVPADPGLV